MDFQNFAGLKKDFPIFKKNPGLIYLDSGAISQKPQVVIDAVSRFYEEQNSNVHRGVYPLAAEATKHYENARKTIANFINAPRPECITHTSGTTKSIHVLAIAWALRNLRGHKGDSVLFTQMEHHSNISPWHELHRIAGIPFSHVKITNTGLLDLSYLKEKLKTGKVKLLTLCHVSNVLATKNPIAEICRMAHEYDVKVHVDGAQSANDGPIDIQNLGCDFFSFSGHKVLGPTGTGVLYVHQDRFNEMGPFLGGGDAIMDVTLTESTFQKMPYILEAGTPNIAGFIGLGEAIKYLQNLGMEKVEQYIRSVGTFAWERLSKIDGIRLVGPGPGEDSSMSLVSFTFNYPGATHPVPNAVIMEVQKEKQVCTRVGCHCARPCVRRMGLRADTPDDGVIRASFHVYNTREEIDMYAETVEETVSAYRRRCGGSCVSRSSLTPSTPPLQGGSAVTNRQGATNPH